MSVLGQGRSSQAPHDHSPTAHQGRTAAAGPRSWNGQARHSSSGPSERRRCVSPRFSARRAANRRVHEAGRPGCEQVDRSPPAVDRCSDPSAHRKGRRNNALPRRTAAGRDRSAFGEEQSQRHGARPPAGAASASRMRGERTITAARAPPGREQDPRHRARGGAHKRRPADGRGGGCGPRKIASLPHAADARARRPAARPRCRRRRDRKKRNAAPAGAGGRRRRARGGRSNRRDRREHAQRRHHPDPSSEPSRRDNSRLFRTGRWWPRTSARPRSSGEMAERRSDAIDRARKIGRARICQQPQRESTPALQRRGRSEPRSALSIPSNGRDLGSFFLHHLTPFTSVSTWVLNPYR